MFVAVADGGGAEFAATIFGWEGASCCAWAGARRFPTFFVAWAGGFGQNFVVVAQSEGHPVW